MTPALATSRLLVVCALAVTLSACGVSVGMRPLPETTGDQALAAAPAAVESRVAGVTVTSQQPSTTSTSAPIGGGAPTGDTTDDTVPSDTTSTTILITTTTTSQATTTSAEPETTTTTQATTTTTETPPSTTISIPDIPDVGTVFDVDNDFATHDCGGGDVTVKGDAGTYTLEGTCGSVVVKGSFNTVFIDSVSTIDLTGTLNAVVYGEGNPTVNDWEGSNIVTGG